MGGRVVLHTDAVVDPVLVVRESSRVRRDVAADREGAP